MIPCESCLCLPLCVNIVKFTKRHGTKYTFSYGYGFGIQELENKCSIVSNYVNQRHSNFFKLKNFYLRRRGLIDEKICK